MDWFTASYFFLQYFSSGLAQNGDENDQLNAINGFYLSDIVKELHRGNNLKCSICRRSGGYVGCASKRCQKAGHFPCLHRLGYTFHYGGNFEAYCPKHCPTQPSLGNFSKSDGSCCICLSPLDSAPEQLYCPCCLMVFHRMCVQV